LFRSDRKQNNGFTLIPWQGGWTLCWDVTVMCLLAHSYVSAASHRGDTAADIAHRSSFTCGEEMYQWWFIHGLWSWQYQCRDC